MPVTRAPGATRASGARLYRHAMICALVGASLVSTATWFDAPVESAGAVRNVGENSSRAPLKPRDAEQVANPVNANSPESLSTWDGDFVSWVERKYRYLLADTASTEVERKKLMQLLLEREHVASLLDSRRRTVDPAVLRIDSELRALLPAADFADFQLLEDSDEEQHHLLDYAGGVSNAAPLTAQQERAILEIKLRHKQAYEVALLQAGLERDRLSVAEREYAHGAIAAALRAYRNDYLQEVRNVLGEEQYVLLSNYETTEFNRELERLQRAINAK
jgi:hypothetical protein